MNSAASPDPGFDAYYARYEARYLTSHKLTNVKQLRRWEGQALKSAARAAYRCDHPYIPPYRQPPLVPVVWGRDPATGEFGPTQWVPFDRS
jgi:hypothetical protein